MFQVTMERAFPFTAITVTVLALYRCPGVSLAVAHGTWRDFSSRVSYFERVLEILIADTT